MIGLAVDPGDHQIKFGEITFSGKDLPPQPAKYDRIAVSEGRELLFVSLVAESNFVKAIRSILGGGAKAEIKASGGRVRRPNRPHEIEVEPGNIYKTDGLYDFYCQKLEHGLVHAMFFTRNPSFITVVSDDAIWRELRDIRYTTPILLDWLPYLRAQLEKRKLLDMAGCYNCECGVLTATDAELDAIVSAGLKSGEIRIPASVPA